jgi:hypothetical protein
MKKNANELKSNLPIFTLIQDEIKKLLNEIYIRIDDSSKINEIEIFHQLPTNFFHLNNKFLTNEDIQKRIYYKIIKDLEDNNYQVKIRIQENQAVLKISWKIIVNSDEEKKIDEKLKSLHF